MSAKYVRYQFGYAAWGYIFQTAVLLVLTVTGTVLIILITKYGMTDILIYFLKTFG